MSEPVLAHPDYTQPFMVETDASDYALGAILCQQGDSKKSHPIAFYSHKLLPAERNYSVYDKELLAIVYAFREWRHHLLATKFPIEVITDHSNLRYFSAKQILTPRHARWSATLLEYNFVISHRAGKANIVADALSRRSDLVLTGEELRERSEQVLIPESQFQAVAAVDEHPLWKETVLDPGRQLEILRQRHDSKTAGHLGISKTFKLVSKEFWWPGQFKYVKEYVRGCEICQRNKVDRHLPYGLLQPLPISKKPWASISLDFIVKLPQVQQFDSILVVVDRFTKNVIFIPTQESISAVETADLFFAHVYRQRGLPDEIISDRGPQFRSEFWKALFEALGTNIKLSSAYHPQTDGQTERVNQTLEQYLRCFCSYDQDNWVDLLPFAEFAYNNSSHEAIGVSPFLAMYGWNPKADFLNHPVVQDEQDTSPLSVEDRLKYIHSWVGKHLETAKDNAKVQADRKRKDHSFKVGDKVLLLTRNLSTDRPSLKLDYRKIGPFPILHRINEVTFKLDLPAALRIHPVIHVSLLEVYNESTIEGQSAFQPTILVEGSTPEYELEEILQSKKRNNVIEYLVKWEGNTTPSWEVFDNLQTYIDKILEFHRANPRSPIAAELQEEFSDESSSEENSDGSEFDDSEGTNLATKRAKFRKPRKTPEITGVRQSLRIQQKGYTRWNKK